MIVCSAIKLYCPNSKLGDIIICGLRHADCYEIFNRLDHELYRRATADPDNVHEGFIDTNNNFLSREQAYDHAIACGQIPAQLREDKANRGENILYSEDLY